jgi:hypothetical protein
MCETRVALCTLLFATGCRCFKAIIVCIFVFVLCKKKNQDVKGSGAREEQAHRKRALVHHEAAVEVKGAQPGSLKQHKKPKHRRRLQRRFRQRLFMGTGGSSVRCGLASAGDDGGKKKSAASKAAAGATALSA